VGTPLRGEDFSKDNLCPFTNRQAYAGCRWAALPGGRRFLSSEGRPGLLAADYQDIKIGGAPNFLPIPQNNEPGSEQQLRRWRIYIAITILPPSSGQGRSRQKWIIAFQSTPIRLGSNQFYASQQDIEKPLSLSIRA